MDQIKLKSLLNYNCETGVFKWINTKGNVKGGSVAGRSMHGYVSIKIDGRDYMAHRLAWLYVHGEWPKNEIDHINRNRSDNSIINLRDVTRQCNQHNHGIRKDNTSGYRGVFFNKKEGKYEARVRLNGKRLFLGYFITSHEASVAYESKKSEINLSLA